MPKWRCWTEAVEYWQTCRRWTDFSPAFRHLHMILTHIASVLRILCLFLSSPAGCTSEEEDRKQARRKAEKEEYGICVYWYLVCMDPPPPPPPPPPPLPYLARPASPACGYGYQDRRYSGEPPPPLSPTPHFKSQRPQRWFSRTASDLEVVNIKTDIVQ